MKKVLFSVIAVLLLLPSLAHADGGVFPPPDRWVYETGQKAAIVFKDNTETLVLSTSFQGDAKDFAYIVPTPSQPEVSKVSDDIFLNLSEMTIGEIVYDPMPLAGFGAAENKADVSIVEEKKVGIFDVTVLTANNADALYDWLKENNFTYPITKKYILDDYIQNNWFFTTAKISPEAISGDVENKVHQGDLTPLRFVFSSDKIVFPFKISSVIDKEKIPDIVAFTETTASYNPDESISKEIAPVPPLPYSAEVPITLYIFSDHKKEIPGFSTDYANWIKGKDIETLAKDDIGNSWVNVEKKMYLTKLSSYMSYADMTSDLFPDNAKDNKVVGVPSWWERNSLYLGIIFAFIILLFYIFTYWQFTSENKKCHLICWILQIIIFILTGAPLALLFFIAILSQSYYFYMDYNYGFYVIILSTLILNIPISMIVIMLLQKYHQKKNR